MTRAMVPSNPSPDRCISCQTAIDEVADAAPGVSVMQVAPIADSGRVWAPVWCQPSGRHNSKLHIPGVSMRAKMVGSAGERKRRPDAREYRHCSPPAKARSRPKASLIGLVPGNRDASCGQMCSVAFGLVSHNISYRP